MFGVDLRDVGDEGSWPSGSGTDRSAFSGAHAKQLRLRHSSPRSRRRHDWPSSATGWPSSPEPRRESRMRQQSRSARPHVAPRSRRGWCGSSRGRRSSAEDRCRRVACMRPEPATAVATSFPSMDIDPRGTQDLEVDPVGPRLRDGQGARPRGAGARRQRLVIGLGELDLCVVCESPSWCYRFGPNRDQAEAGIVVPVMSSATA